MERRRVIHQSFVAGTWVVRLVWHDALEQDQTCGLHRIDLLMSEQALRARPGRRR